MNLERALVFFVVVAVFLATVSACSGKNGTSRFSGDTPAADSAVTSVSVEGAKSAVENYSPPEGVDPELFAMLSEKFMKDYEAISEGRMVAQDETAEPDLVLTTTDNGNESWTYEWEYYNIGDYDLNGEVGVPDITPIAVNYLLPVEGILVRIRSFIDGDGDGEIGVPDITPIATNYLNIYEISAAFFVDAPSLEWSLSEWDENALYSIRTGTNWQEHGMQKLTLNNNKDFYGVYGRASVIFANAVLPQEPGAYYFGVRSAADPPRFVSTGRISIGQSGVPVVGSVSPLEGWEGDEATFSVEMIEGIEPFEYSWGFGGAATPNTSTEESPTVTLGEPGTYDAVLTVTNDFGEDVFDFEFEVISLAPSIKDVQPQSGTTNSEVTFTPTITGILPMTYDWDFGGGADPDTSTDETPTVTLVADSDDYSASLTATNEYGTDEFDFTLTVGGEAPVITEVSPLEGDMDEEVTFSATVIGEEPLSYTWTFGDAATPATSTQASPTVTLARFDGKYDCNLSVSNSWGEGTFDFEITVNYVDLPPLVHSVSPTGGPTGTPITIQAVVSGMEPITYAWDFGGGADPDTSDLPSPTITLGDPGEYSASLYVENGLGNDTYDFALNSYPEGGDWASEIVDFGGSNATGLGISLVFLPTGEPMIAYKAKVSSSNRVLKVAKKVGETWQIEVVHDGDGGYTGAEPCITLDPSGNPVIAFQYENDGDYNTYNDLLAAWWNGSSWDISLIEGDGTGLNRCGFGTDIGFLPSGEGFVAHFRHMDMSTPSQVRQLLWNGSSWSGQTVVSLTDIQEDGIYDTGSVLIADGNPVITAAYFIGSSVSFNSFWYNGSGWNQSTIASIKQASSISAALDGNGNPCVAYYHYDPDISDGDLKYVAWNGSWGASEPVYTVGKAGSYCSLAFSPTGNPWISFLDKDNSELRVSNKVGASWENEVVDSGGGSDFKVGKYTSLAFDSDGVPHIAYQQYSSGDYALKYATLY
ncbi:PKD domain-containing protein [bacterium]|nr:PKD domain-containing protein [bacterium]